MTMFDVEFRDEANTVQPMSCTSLTRTRTNIDGNWCFMNNCCSSQLHVLAILSSRLLWQVLELRVRIDIREKRRIAFFKLG